MATTKRVSTNKRPKIGDVVEIRTPKGLGYFQYVERDPTLGPRIRVLPGTFDERPNIGAVAMRKAAYYVHFPLGAAVSRGLVAIVGSAPLPDPGPARRPEDDLYRLQSIWNDTLLAERIAEGWSPI
jgi:hypothetical protein